ncbi:MAG: aldo/keto reductase [Pseudonocardia sp.]|mgnify:FL=1|uniref:aldo/keto reductase n=1 Tax=unclassified Pseudonocardia TaxID=2619320 RepID=UPI0008688221|nr:MULTISPECIES: aldo/keto reductase [unclassified Pseudonocardia]MBN9108951.1 aldo/keto reductase [Pseudonocardia sp.]ODV03563.1 MAG: oxidoreductase [Pseudonocardia sp. SCN 73-27]
MSSVPNLTLNNGVAVPQFGFGVFQVGPGETVAAVTQALEAGYRHIDTAQAYRNEAEVGRAIAESGLAREEVFVTTKLANDRQGRDSAVSALGESLEKLGLDFVDLYLVHWPRPQADVYVETWEGMERCAKDGAARAIGVSNFQVPHLERLAAETATVPAVNQIELHPLLGQADLREYHLAHGIVTEAWAPIAKGGELLSDERLVAIGRAHGKSAAQVVLRWHVQLGNVVFPKSVTPSRIRENIDVFDFTLSDDEMATVSGLDAGTRLGPDPDRFG